MGFGAPFEEVCRGTQHCGIKWISHRMRLWERVVEEEAALSLCRCIESLQKGTKIEGKAMFCLLI